MHSATSAPEPAPTDQPAEPELRRWLRLASLNAALWAIGNGLVSTTLVTFLAMDLGAKGMAVSLILAAPRMAGVLRLAVPAAIGRLAARKAFCIGMYLASACVLAGLPWVASGSFRGLPASIGLLVAYWCVYHLLEYSATVALWSWLGDLLPTQRRGRLLGRRESWLVIGRAMGVGASIALAAVWRWSVPDDAPRWHPLALSAAAGAVLLALAPVALLGLPGLACRPSAVPQLPWQSLMRAVSDRGYRRLLLLTVWTAAANAVTTTAQTLYPQRVLGIDYATMAAARCAMYAGQSGLAPVAGQIIDRGGWMRALSLAQVLVAAGPLCFWLATPDQSWWFAVAYLLWIPYAVINTGLDWQKLQLAPSDNNAPHLAVYDAISDLASSLLLLSLGWVYETLDAGGPAAVQLYAQLFLLGAAARLSVVIPIMLVGKYRAAALAYRDTRR